jgi:glycosyltransferase involved in cell wall biosynthesis
VRIAIVNWSRRKVGGVETHLNSIIPEIGWLGHETAFLSEVDVPVTREQIALPQGTPAWCVAEIGEEQTLHELSDWRPDLIYVHKVSDPRFEESLLKVAPAVFFAHDYYGTCISGLKTFQRPKPMPCSRRFGWQCLLHYFPHQCGGRSPVTMLRLYRLQSKRLRLLHKYKAVLTHSEHLKVEYINHGLDPARVFNLSYYAHRARINSGASLSELSGAPGADISAPGPSAGDSTRALRLLFLGRMDRLKGGGVFLDALPEALAFLGKPLHVVFAGDGPERSVWERQALAVQSQHENIKIEFSGWSQGSQLEALWSACDLLVVPSLWPEPFGLVGVEAGMHGVPAAAFAVGGIPTWLSDGVNGYLAPGNPPTSTGLAVAVVKCLKDPLVHARLRLGAEEKARHFNLESHLCALNEVFEHVMHELNTGVA